MVSRWLGKRKAKRNVRQLAKRKAKESTIPVKHRIGKEAHDSAHDGTHPTANTFINDQHDTQEQLDRKKLAAAKKKTTKKA